MEQGTPILYRPHFYLEPNAPYFGNYNHNQAVTAQCIQYAGHGVSFSKTTDDCIYSSSRGSSFTDTSLWAAPDSIVLNGVDTNSLLCFFQFFLQEIV